MPLEPSYTGLRAWAVLSDARKAAGELSEVSKTGDRDLYRVRWVAAISLVRAVGNVLKNVDSELSQTHREVISEKWRKADKPPIYTDFIEEIRNLTLKEYRTGLFAVVDPNTSPLTVVAEEASAMADPNIAVTSPGPLEFRFKNGPLAERSIDEVMKGALDWWTEYLHEVEAEIARRACETSG